MTKLPERDAPLEEILDFRTPCPPPDSDNDWLFHTLGGAVFLLWILLAYAAVKAVGTMMGLTLWAMAHTGSG